MFGSVKRKFSTLPDPPGFSISCTPKTYETLFAGMTIEPDSVLYEVGCGKGYVVVYALLSGFTIVRAIDIEELSVQRTQHVLAECRKDSRFSAGLLGTVSVNCGDALSTPIPQDVTHVTSIIVWTDQDFAEMLRLILDSDCKKWATIASSAQIRILQDQFGVEHVNIIRATLETSGEKRRIAVVQW